MFFSSLFHFLLYFFSAKNEITKKIEEEAKYPRGKIDFFYYDNSNEINRIRKKIDISFLRLEKYLGIKNILGCVFLFLLLIFISFYFSLGLQNYINSYSLSSSNYISSSFNVNSMELFEIHLKNSEYTRSAYKAILIILCFYLLIFAMLIVFYCIGLKIKLSSLLIMASMSIPILFSLKVVGNINFKNVINIENRFSNENKSIDINNINNFKINKKEVLFIKGFKSGSHMINDEMNQEILQKCDLLFSENNISGFIIGSTDKMQIGNRNKKIYESNTGLAQLRAESVSNVIKNCENSRDIFITSISGPKFSSLYSEEIKDHDGFNDRSVRVLIFEKTDSNQK